MEEIIRGYLMGCLFWAIFLFIRDFLIPEIFKAVCNFSVYCFGLIVSVYKYSIKDYKTYFFAGCSLGLVFTSQWF